MSSLTVKVATSRLNEHAHEDHRSDSSSDEYYTSRKSGSIKSKLVRQRTKNAGFDIPPDVRSSSRLAAKSATYQFSESSEIEEEPLSYIYVDPNDDRPAIDIVLTHRWKRSHGKWGAPNF